LVQRHDGILCGPSLALGFHCVVRLARWMGRLIGDGGCIFALGAAGNDDPGGEVQPPVVQGLGFSDRPRAVQQQGLGEAGEVWAARTNSSGWASCAGGSGGSTAS